MFKFDVVVVGGAGHVGLPLGLMFAKKGLRVCLFDTNQKNLALISKGKMPFIEYGAEPILKDVINKNLKLSTKVSSAGQARYVIITVGTPVDEYFNPKFKTLTQLFVGLKPYLKSDQTIVIRSTVYPGTCQQILSFLQKDGKKWRVAYCPERIAQGYAIQELEQLPQLVAGMDPKALEDSTALFSKIAASVLPVSMSEAELAKLFSNAWRYIQFAVANQFFMIANDFGVDFNRLREVMVEGYGRAANLPSAGFAAGPCLMKDTLQLAAFNKNNFSLGQAAMTVNEGLPYFIVDKLRQAFDISKKKVGILGMAFKADIDDIRDSLSYKLGKILRFYGAHVYYSDEFAKDPTFISKEKLVNTCDVVIVGVPHSAYKKLPIPKKVHLVDIWGLYPSRNCL